MTARRKPKARRRPLPLPLPLPVVGERWPKLAPAQRVLRVRIARPRGGALVIAAIGTDGTRPVVWGLGETRAEAATDAYETDDTWTAGGKAYVEVDERIAGRVIEGLIDCDSLGIAVTLRDGSIVDAQIVGARYPEAGA